MTQRRLALGELPDWPRYLSLREAAAYLGVSPDLFAREVRLGVWPPARARAARLTWIANCWTVMPTPNSRTA